MDACQEPKNTDDKVPVLAVVVKQFLDQFVRQAEDKNKLPMNITGTFIEQLNDYCLLEIFSVKSLTLMDLCSLAETCTLFQRISQRVFSPKDFRIYFSSNLQDVIAGKYLPSTYIECIKRIFKNFGSCLSELAIYDNYHGRESSNFWVNLVAEYCVESLDSLGIRDMKIPAFVIVKLKPIFKRLQMLDLFSVDIGADKTIFADLNSLIELRVRFVVKDSAILENIFPNLERFIFHGYEFQIDHPLLTFISRHRSLKMLHLKIFIDDKFEMNFLQVIGNSCMELEELDFDIGPTNASSLQPLQALQSLKTLKLRRVFCDHFKFCAFLPNLRELHLYFCNLPKDPNQFAPLAQLTKLDIIGGFRYFDVVQLIRRLTKLEELTISLVLNEEAFSVIVNVVKGRPNVLTLKCKWNFVLNSKSCDDSRKVRLERFDGLIDCF